MQASTGLTDAQVQALLRRRERMPIRVPITALYSKTDGVVPWRADVEHIEVSSSHVGFGVNAQVFRIVAERLDHPRPQAASR